MTNMIRADIYRLLRGKALYITFAVLLLLHVLVIGVGAVGGINFGNTWEDVGIEAPVIGFDGLNSAALLYTRLDNTVFFLLPLIIAASVAIFTNDTVKNDIAWGISRTRLYLSKLLLSAGLCVLLVLFYMATGMLMATILRGFGGPAPAGYWLNLFQTVGAQLFVMLALTCLGVFMAFAFRCSSIVTTVYIVFCMAPIMIIVFLAETLDSRLIRLLDFDLMFTINRLGFLNQLETRVILTAFGVGTVYILATTVGGIALFKRAEIK